MVINWYGEGCFKISSGDTVLLTDPFESSTGLTPPRLKPHLAILTRSSYPPAYEHAEYPLIVGPGEYAIAGIEASGWMLSPTNPLHTAYRVSFEDLTLGLLGHLSQMPEADIIEHLGGVDLLVVPAGGAPFIGAEPAATLIKQINPRIVIASFIHAPGLKRKTTDGSTLFKELGQKVTPQEKLVVKKKDLPQTTQVVALTL